MAQDQLEEIENDDNSEMQPLDDDQEGNYYATMVTKMEEFRE